MSATAPPTVTVPSPELADAALLPGPLVDSDHPDVIAFAHSAADGATEPSEIARRLFLAVRDGLRYDPYAFSLDPDRYRASLIVHAERTWCVPKAVLLAATARAMGIPALLGFADVRNHLSTPKLLERMGTDVFAWHGYVALRLGERWLKASPAFNAELCELFGVEPLDFDGTADALLHAYDGAGRRYMEYTRDRGLHLDVPLSQMAPELRRTYPQMVDAPGSADAAGDDGGF